MPFQTTWVVPAAPLIRSNDQFYSKAGQPISLSEWAALRADADYCRVGYWEGEGGAWVYTFWLGLNMSFGVGAAPTVFETQVAAFGNQPVIEWTCSSDTLRRALALHSQIVRYVERGITPPHWNLQGL